MQTAQLVHGVPESFCSRPARDWQKSHFGSNRVGPSSVSKNKRNPEPTLLLLRGLGIWEGRVYLFEGGCDIFAQIVKPLVSPHLD